MVKGCVMNIYFIKVLYTSVSLEYFFIHAHSAKITFMIKWQASILTFFCCDFNSVISKQAEMPQYFFAFEHCKLDKAFLKNYC